MQLNPCSETGQAACNKYANSEKQHNPIARIEILFGYQFANLCVLFFNAQNEIFIFCQSANWKKMSPQQCAHRNQSDQNGSFWKIEHMGRVNKCAYRDQNARKNIVNLYSITYILTKTTQIRNKNCLSSKRPKGRSAKFCVATQVRLWFCSINSQ